jgi:Putative serine esterase (DUF676)
MPIVYVHFASLPKKNRRSQDIEKKKKKKSIQEKMHLIVLLHGIDSPLGSANDLAHIESTINEIRWQGEQVHTLRSQCNVGETHKGILRCGRRLAHEIANYLSHHHHQKTNQRKERKEEDDSNLIVVDISFVAHSLGGLIARACIGWLHAHNLFACQKFSNSSSAAGEKERMKFGAWKFRPICYVSVATPHLGVRRVGFIWHAAKQFLQFYWFGRTIFELLLLDADTDVAVQNAVRRLGARHARERELLDAVRGHRRLPLLFVMSEPGTPFFDGLALFERRTLVAAVKFDMQVPYPSCALVEHNRYYVDDPKRQLDGSVAVQGFEAPLAEYLEKRALIDRRISASSEAMPSSSSSSSSSRVDALNDNAWQLSSDWPFHEMLYHPAMMRNLSTLAWRRIDVALDSLFSHDLLVAKPSLPFYSTERGKRICSLVANIVLYDHRQHSRIQSKL